MSENSETENSSKNGKMVIVKVNKLNGACQWKNRQCVMCESTKRGILSQYTNFNQMLEMTGI